MSANPFKAWLRASRRPTAASIGLVADVGRALYRRSARLLRLRLPGARYGACAPSTSPEAVSILRAIAGTAAEPLVRLAWNDQVLVKRVLDVAVRAHGT